MNSSERAGSEKRIQHLQSIGVTASRNETSLPKYQSNKTG